MAQIHFQGSFLLSFVYHTLLYRFPKLNQRIPPSMNQRQKCVKDYLLPYLDKIHHLIKIEKDHGCFKLPEVRSLVEKYFLNFATDNRWQNFQQLLCGYQDLPAIILLNPSNAHTEDFSKMALCPTIKWISDTLDKIGLKVEDVPILDICGFFSSNDLEDLGELKWIAVEESYRATDAILRYLQPSTVVSCQCATKGQYQIRNYVWTESWRIAGNELARSLASSKLDMLLKRARPVPLDSEELWMVNGIHPMAAIRERQTNEKISVLGKYLELVFQEVYGPCVLWLRAREREDALRRNKHTIHSKESAVVTVNEVAEDEKLASGFSRLAIVGEGAGVLSAH